MARSDRVTQPAYISWCKMKTRCNNPNYHAYHRYGGRGIFYASAWESFDVFLSDMGESPPGYTLDRIDPDHGYYKENCRWATKSDNCRVKTAPILTEDKVRLMKALFRSRNPRYSLRYFFSIIGPLFNMEPLSLFDIYYGKSWAGVS